MQYPEACNNVFLWSLLYYYQVRNWGVIAMGKKINKVGLNLIKESEGLYLEAYLCPAKVWTIGYGTIKGVSPGMKITEQEAERLLLEEVTSFEEKVDKELSHVELNENQFSALVSICYNCGLAPIVVGKTIRRNLDKGDYQGAADGFLLWTKGGGKVLPGLVKRRNKERDLFLTPVANNSIETDSQPLTPSLVPPSDEDSDPNTRVVIQVLVDTHLKASTKQLTELSDDEKSKVAKDNLLVATLLGTEGVHYHIRLDGEEQSRDWFIYKDHVELFRSTT